MMLRKTIIMAVIWLTLVIGSWAQAGPVAVFESPVHTFELIPEGTHIDHVFTVKNKGDADLNITNVLPP